MSRRTDNIGDVLERIFVSERSITDINFWVKVGKREDKRLTDGPAALLLQDAAYEKESENSDSVSVDSDTSDTSDDGNDIPTVLACLKRLNLLHDQLGDSFRYWKAQVRNPDIRAYFTEEDDTELVETLKIMKEVPQVARVG